MQKVATLTDPLTIDPSQCATYELSTNLLETKHQFVLIVQPGLYMALDTVKDWISFWLVYLQYT